MSRPIIAVIGATGAQGGGLAQAILTDPQRRYALRALTRKTDGAAARALAVAGAEVVAADLDDENSLVRAFAGAHGVFAVTNFWEHFSPEREVAQAGNIARTAKKAAVKHIVWSTLEDTRKFVPLSDPRLPTLGGKYKVPHYDGKGEADALFAGLPVTYLQTVFYWDNLIHFGMGPRRDANGKLLFVLPMGDAKLSGIAVADIGPAALALFARGPEVIGRTVGIAGEHLSGAEIAAELSRALGETVTHYAMAPADYAKLGFPGADDLANMFEFKRMFEAEYRASRPVEATRRLYPGLQSFRTWLERNVQKVPVAAAA
ncbi:MAG TPA: NmrA/HSCARG family protein [Steroidobacteraceae bacterium]|nr:NmrA/HSCARG family protein [Steroidobacteraceae bacterium]